jgi:sugar lactone lactonase YvrE
MKSGFETGIEREKVMERIRRSTKRLAAWVAGLVCAAVIAPVALEAQSVNFAGSQTTVAGGFADVVSIAADSNGNIYVADFANSVVQEIVAVNGSIPASPTIRTLGSGFFGPRGVAVDASGNVYVGDTKDNQVKEIVAVNGSIPAAPTILTLGSGFNLPTGVVVDAAGDVFVADFGTNAVKEILAVNGSIPASPTIVTFDSEFGGPGGLALDSTGNLYVAATTSGLVQEILAVNGSIPASPAILTLTSDLSDLLGVAVDSTGNIYVSATFVDEVQEIVAVNGSIPASPTILSLGVGLGGESGIALDPSGNIYTGGNHSGLVIELQTKAINVGSAAAATPTPVSVALAFNFDAGGSIAAPVVLTQGATGLDFTDAGTGTCTTNGVSHIYNAGDSCTVNVTFAPRLPGARNGAVEIVDASGNVLATSLVYGTGDGPQIAFSPPAQSTISSGLSYPYGVAVDGSGNLYIVDSGNDRVLKETLGGGSYTQSTIVSGLNNPWGVAVDGSGNVYIVDSGNQRVLKETLSGGSYTQSTISSGLYEPHGVAVDGSGNLYIADTNNNRVLKETPSGGSYTQSTIGNGLNGPYGVAVDASGNVYISAVWGNDVLKETLNGSSYIQSTVASSLDQPLGVAVDGGGNVYIDDTYNNRVLKEALSGGSYTQSTVGSGLSFPFGVATDGSGNIYISDTSHQRVLKEDYADPSSLSFAATVVGSTSSDSPQSVTVENIGNANLTGSVNSISASFAQVDGPGTPADCAQSFSIAPGSACNLGLGFTPLSVGSIPGSATLFSNSLNGTQVQSQIELAGTGQQTPPVVTGISPSQGSLAGGTVVTITGTSFNGATAVRFGSSPATSLSVKDTTIIATAPAEAAGTVDVTVTTQSGTSVTSAADRFTYVNPLTAAQSIASAALTQNHAASSFTPVTGSGGTAPFAYSVSPALPTGLSFNASTGAISGTPTATHALSSFTVSITDVNGANATNSFSLTVNPAVLAAQAAPSVALTYSSAANVTPVTGSGGTPPLSYSVIPVLPVGLSFNTSTGAITGTPTAVINSANYAVTVTDANGASASNTFSLSVGKATATVTLSNLAQIYTGSALSATAATNPANLSVSFTYNGSAAAPTAAGSYTVVATIASGGNYTGTATGTLVISPATASTLLTAATLTPTPGQSDLLTATVAGAGSLSGLVVFKAGATAICTTTVNAAGVAVCSYTPGITGAVQVSAQYQADSNHTSSNVATVTLNVAATYDAAITVQYASTQLVYPGATNITVCIAPAHNITATGSVQIYDGTTLLTTLSVQGGGCAYWYISPGLAAGNHVLTAVYSGDKNNPGGTSAPTTIHVAPVPVNMAPSCWLTNSGYGANYQCTVSLSSNAGSAQGVMTYSYDGGTAVSVAINNGTANFTLTRPAAGKHSVQIAYAQQTNYAVAGPVTENFTVAPAQVQVALTPSSWYTSASGGISFAAAVNSSSPGAPSSNGSVEFFDGNTLLATVPVNANGQASFSTTKLAAGSHTIAATYSGGVNYASSSSSVTITLTP